MTLSMFSRKLNELDLIKGEKKKTNSKIDKTFTVIQNKLECNI